MTEDNAEGACCIQTTTELPPQRIRTREDFFERDHVAADRGHQAQTDLPVVGRGCQIVREFFEEGQMGQVQILRIINDETLDLGTSGSLNQPEASDIPRHTGNHAKDRRESHCQRLFLAPILWRSDSK